MCNKNRTKCFGLIGLKIWINPWQRVKINCIWIYFNYLTEKKMYIYYLLQWKGLSTKLAIRFEQIFTIKILPREKTKRETRGQPYLMQYTMLSHWSHLGKRGVPAGPKNWPLSKRMKWGKLWRIILIKTAKESPDGTFKWIHVFSFIFLLYYTFHDL